MARTIAAAQASASVGRAKVAKKPSPAVSISRPPVARRAARTSA